MCYRFVRLYLVIMFTTLESILGRCNNIIFGGYLLSAWSCDGASGGQSEVVGLHIQLAKHRLL
jgi:hypothetical protein